MKTILAVGELGSYSNIYKASLVAMMAGSDFIKTSTGKESVNATIPVGLVMTQAIKNYYQITGYKVSIVIERFPQLPCARCLGSLSLCYLLNPSFDISPGGIYRTGSSGRRPQRVACILTLLTYHLYLPFFSYFLTLLTVLTYHLYFNNTFSSFTHGL